MSDLMTGYVTLVTYEVTLHRANSHKSNWERAGMLRYRTARETASRRANQRRANSALVSQKDKAPPLLTSDPIWVTE